MYRSRVAKTNPVLFLKIRYMLSRVWPAVSVNSLTPTAPMPLRANNSIAVASNSSPTEGSELVMAAYTIVTRPSRTNSYQQKRTSQLPAIDKALRQGPAAHGLDTKVWTSDQVRVVIQQVTGVQLVPSAVKRLLREQLGWTVQQP